MIEKPKLDWRKSSFSDSGDINDCVEVAGTPAQIHVRDSKDTALPHLTFTPHAWTGFVSHASAS
ncbi:DUF397 domain-containing protein [Streptomyces lavendulae subsp. lavendulae]|uniref:DUF397 domain-containing protein n=1 Tax=Streptomyces lavendulae TaxID=1914 RepID=UPI0024A486BC|nr:DUF397 domain-containing protein [Streptomyces lavendulae]GLV83914.1 DUF397 domain-containing protein [Streptomyces lavendulae subsp. lavendulae]